MRYSMFLSCAAVLAALSFSSPSYAWNEQNCIQACRQTANSVQACIVKHNCAQYRGSNAASKTRVNNFSRDWNRRNRQ